MSEMKDIPNAVAVLLDVVSSRQGDRARQHADLLRAVDVVNAAVPALDPLHPTVGDELQGVYSSLGDALNAVFRLRLLVSPGVDLRAGIGGGEVRVIDAEHRIQDGSAWWRAREAIDAVKALATATGYRSARVGIQDARPAASPSAGPLSRLVDSSLHRLRPGVAATLLGVLDEEDNATIAERQGISPSANSQRVGTNDLRIVADAIRALGELP
ncbi:SatD family protein [Tessaracoccus caeni]|uniref:SatD family protein n=1 Tax=Tessaracoccus caeni TaxID=3031239 RepID=UPI0023DAAB25|nr:SatD family protein [Tessaracoccus caeni]MDF1487778.1 SatD family protein [Tessaracoccus caeni]